MRWRANYMDRFIDKGRADLVAEMFYEIPLTIALHFWACRTRAPSSCASSPWRTLNTWGRPTPEEQLKVAENVGRFWQVAQKILET